MLKPDKNIQKYLISTPCYFVGEYETDKFRLDLTFPSIEESFTFLANMSSSPFSRNFIKVIYNSEPSIEDAENELSNGHHTFVKRMTILMAIIFGKCFYQHGFVEENGNSFIADYQDLKPQRYYFIPPFNQLPRKDLGDLTTIESPVRISLEKIQIITPLIDNILYESEFNNIFFTAGSFYLHSLQSLNDEPEIAYLDLISCGEVLSSYTGFDFSEKDLLPEELMEDFEKLEAKCNDFINVRAFRNYFRSIKRRFTLTLLYLLNDYYFENQLNDLPQSKHIRGEYLKRISKENAEKHLKFSYDLRSQYLHAGKPFRQYIMPFTNMITETRIGEVPKDIGDSVLRKTINNSLTYVGLERLMRFCLLRFIQKFDKIHLDDRLNDG